MLWVLFVVVSEGERWIELFIEPLSDTLYLLRLNLTNSRVNDNHYHFVASREILKQKAIC